MNSVIDTQNSGSASRLVISPEALDRFFADLDALEADTKAADDAVAEASAAVKRAAEDDGSTSAAELLERRSAAARALDLAEIELGRAKRRHAEAESDYSARVAHLLNDVRDELLRLATEREAEFQRGLVELAKPYNAPAEGAVAKVSRDLLINVGGVGDRRRTAQQIAGAASSSLSSRIGLLKVAARLL